MVLARGGRLALAAFLWFHAVFIGVTATLVVCYSFTDPPVTVLSLVRKYSSGWTIRKPRPVGLGDVPRLTRRMLVSVEDSKFWTHPGIDLEAVRRAAEVNRAAGKTLYGGSTITMQVARTLFLTPDRTWLRKYLEVLVTAELELFLSKERILELYLSWAEWGKGVFGIEAATRLYYGKSVSALGMDESARILAILSSPIRYTPATMSGSGLLRARYDYLMKKYGG